MSPTLYEQWSSQNDKHLDKTPISVRLPVHIVARLKALQEMHPDKSRNDLFVDLIKAAFDVFEETLPAMEYEIIPIPEEDGYIEIKSPKGYRADYYRAANKHYKEIEAVLGNTKALDIFDVRAREVEK